MPSTLIFDGQCPRCLRLARILESVAGKGRLRILSMDAPGAMDLHPDLEYARALKAPQLLLENGHKAESVRHVPAMIEADLAFHQEIYAASGKPLIETIALVHWRHIRREMGAVLQRSGLRESVVGGVGFGLGGAAAISVMFTIR